MENELSHKIEAILFYSAEPVSVDFLVKTLEVSRDDVLLALEVLEKSLQTRGLRVVFHNDEAVLVTAPDFSDIIEKIVKDERERDLGRAGIETLSIVAYKGPVGKKEIEYIRGVNSQFALRNLLLRGLVEKRPSEENERVMVYTITTDALRHLGLNKISDLPEYSAVRKELEVPSENEFDEENI